MRPPAPPTGSSQGGLDEETETALHRKGGDTIMADNESVLNPNELSDEQAMEIHGYFVRGVQVWAAVAFIAHVLVWQWLPWFPG